MLAVRPLLSASNDARLVMKYLESKCPKCSGIYEFSTQDFGQEWICPHCNESIQVRRKNWTDVIDPAVPTICVLFFSAVYCIAFSILLGVLGIFGLCLLAGVFSSMCIYKGLQQDSGICLSKTLSGWVATIVCIGMVCIGWHWYWNLSPLSEAKRTCQELRELYQKNDHTKAFGIIKGLSEDPPPWLIDE